MIEFSKFKLNRVLYSFLLYLCYDYLTVKVHSDMFTAIVNMKDLIQTEKYIKLFLNLYLEAEEKRLENVKRLSQDLDLSNLYHIKDIDFYLSNPVNIYHLVKQVYSETAPLIKLMNITAREEVFNNISNNTTLHFPDAEDLQGVTVALSRLLKTYNMEISSFDNGDIIPDFSSVKKLTARDCLDIGHNLYSNQMYSFAIPWLKEALFRGHKEKIKTIQKKHVIVGLAKSTFKTKDEKIISSMEEDLENMDIDLTNEDFKTYQKTFSYIENVFKKETFPLIDYSISNSTTPMEDEHFNRLCRQEQLQNHRKTSKLKCYLTARRSPFLKLQPIKIEEMHHKPWVAVLHDIINNKEINLVKKLSTPKLERAKVGDGDAADFRISKSSWLNDSQHFIIENISKRLQEITGFDVEKGSESLQKLFHLVSTGLKHTISSSLVLVQHMSCKEAVVNYGIGGHYETHLDFLEEHQFEKGRELERLLGSRIATLLFYMSDVKAGGATVFPRLNITIEPKKGSAAFWFNLRKSGKGDNFTEHGGCPVLAGSKWVANKWFLLNHQQFRKPCGLSKEDYFNGIND